MRLLYHCSTLVSVVELNYFRTGTMMMAIISCFPHSDATVRAWKLLLRWQHETQGLLEWAGGHFLIWKAPFVAGIPQRSA